MIHSNKVITMICRALNLMDGRLVGHGIRVAAIMKDMLEEEAELDKESRKNLCILALFHDVGAYRMEEIDNLVKFESNDIWEHSVFGYLFLREFSPFGDLAGTVLYHHTDYSKCGHVSKEILKYAQMMHVADRADMWCRSFQGKSEEDFCAYLRSKSGTVFPGDVVETFIGANERYGTMKKLGRTMQVEDIIDCSSMDEEEIECYLWMIVHAIDFRSSFTVSHTVSVIEIACRLAEKMGLSEEEQQRIYYGAMLHDIGKIGIPVTILEKEGALTAEEMDIMQKHIDIGISIVQGCVEEKIERIAMRHHEKLNGSGYPDGLKGDDLTLPERILTVADISSALCMKRSYKQAFPKERVFEILDGMRDRGEIDGEVLAVMENAYDEIVGAAKAAAIPVSELHKRIGMEYVRTLDFLTKTREAAAQNVRDDKTKKKEIKNDEIRINKGFRNRKCSN